MSLTMAKSILRMVSAAWVILLIPRITEILVTPWTRASTSRPYSRRSSAVLSPVSSRASCRRAAITVSASRRASTRISATLSG